MNMDPDEREDGAEALVQWAHTLPLRADISTGPLPGVSWKTTSKVMFYYLLTFFKSPLIRLFSRAANFQILSVWGKDQSR